MMSGAASATTSTPSASDLVRHATEIRAILNNDSNFNTNGHSLSYEDGSARRFVSPSTATLTTASSSSPITVLLTGENPEEDDEAGPRRINSTAAVETRPHSSPIYPLSRISQACRHSRPQQDTSAKPLLKHFKTTLWIDRVLFVLGVILPLIVGTCFFLVHSFTNFASCRPVSATASSPNKFVNQICRAKLIQVVLQGAKDSDNEGRVAGSLQHECFPIILILVAILNWIPHFCWRRAVRQHLYRDTCLVASEMRGFRKTAQRELVAIASSINSVPFASSFMPFVREMRFKNSPRPTPIQRGGGDDTTITEPLGSFQLPKPENTVSPGDTGYESEMDLPSAAVMHLPRLRVSRDDHALNLFLAGWQNTDYYVRRFIAKHAVLGLFNGTALCLVAGVCAITQGVPFAGSFYCHPTEKSNTLYICLASTTFALNMAAFCLGSLAVTGLICSAVFFHRNFAHCRVYPESTLACGTKFDFQADLAASLVSRRNENFFSDYIRIQALARMQQRGSLFIARREVFNLRLSFIPGLTQTDFHFLNLICTENVSLFPDAVQLHAGASRMRTEYVDCE
ncbi:unnamed protein product [Mesocestoides corti]|uniref:Transmembrane protein n=1 Tax=Mesocestoides corti TaxID=53468 RepID=A0A0R3U242_MESCO|nr:unnamed protein product [Mesocestoides corti]